MSEYTWYEYEIKNREGLALSAILCNSRNKRATTSDAKEEKTVIVACHGFTGSKEGSGRAIAMAEKLAGSGFSTLLFDFAGCGKSEGQWENISLSGQISDLSSIVAWSRSKDFDRVILNGRSFGGTTALCYAAQDKGVYAVCTWAAVARLNRLFEERTVDSNPFEGEPDQLVSLEGEEGTIFLKRSFFYDLRKHDPPAAAAGLAPRNLLLIHGSADHSVPLRDAELLYEMAKEPKKLVVIEDADHRFSEHLEQVWEAFLKWLKEI